MTNFCWSGMSPERFEEILLCRPTELEAHLAATQTAQGCQNKCAWKKSLVAEASLGRMDVVFNPVFFRLIPFPP